MAHDEIDWDALAEEFLGARETLAGAHRRATEAKDEAQRQADRYREIEMRMGNAMAKLGFVAVVARGHLFDRTPTSVLIRKPDRIIPAPAIYNPED